MTTSEPVRKGVEQEKEKDKDASIDSRSKLYVLLSTPSVLLVLLQGEQKNNIAPFSIVYNLHRPNGRDSRMLAMGIHRSVLERLLFLRGSHVCSGRHRCHGSFLRRRFLGSVGGRMGGTAAVQHRCCALKIRLHHDACITTTTTFAHGSLNCCYWFGFATASEGGPRMQCLLMGCSTILGVFPLLNLLDFGMDDASQRFREPFFDVSIHGTALVAGTLATITGPNVRAVLQVYSLRSVVSSSQQCECQFFVLLLIDRMSVCLR